MATQTIGKHFERDIQDSLKMVLGLTFDRVPDQMSGFYGSVNICDIVAYKKPNIFYFECKTCKSDRFNFKQYISSNQFTGLWDKTYTDGVKAGVFVWFYEPNRTFYIPIQTINACILEGRKSLSVEECEEESSIIEVPFEKRVKYNDYELNGVIKQIQEEE